MSEQDNIKPLNEQELNQLYSQYQDCNLATSQVLAARSSLIEKGFQITDIIAGNQTSLVFKCINIDNNQFVAIKSQICRNQNVLRQFQNYFDTLKLIQNPNLLIIHQIFFDQTTEFLFVVMDLCINGDLYHYQRQNKELSRENMIDVCKQILESIKTLHSYGIIHGDINPSNFLIDQLFTIKLSYQGASKFLFNTLKHTFSDPFTFHFTSKEQLDQSNPSPQSDLFSTGAVLLDLIGLNLDQNLDIAFKIKNNHIESLSFLKEMIPYWFQDMFDIFLVLIQKDNSLQTTTQSIQIINQTILKLVNLPKTIDLNNLKYQICEQPKNQVYDLVEQKPSSIDQTLDQKIEKKTFNLQLKKRIVTNFFNFIYKTNKQCFTFIWTKLKQIILFVIFLLTALLRLLKNNTYQFIIYIKNKFNKNKGIQKEDKSIQTIQQFEDSPSNTPIYKRSKFFSNKQGWNDSAHKQPIEYEMTTLCLDSEETSLEDGINSPTYKTDFDKLLSDDSILSTDILENSGDNRGRSKTETKIHFYSNNQLSSENRKSSYQQRISNASNYHPSSDSQVEDKQREKSNSVCTQKIVSSPLGYSVQSSQPQHSSQQDILFYPNGYYIGEVSNKNPQGQGKMYFHKGNRYEGQFDKGQYDGKGVYFYLGGNKYKGQWKNNLREGHGIFKWANGTTYIGEYDKNIKSGKGNLKFINGERYEGDFLHNCFHGNGKYHFPDGVVFEGQFEDGHRVSTGKFYLLNGEESNNSNYRVIPQHRKYQYKTFNQQDQN